MADRGSSPPREPKIRPSSSGDAPAIAEVWLRSFGAQLPTIRRPHTDDQVREWIVGQLVPTHETWVADGPRPASRGHS